MTRNEVFLDAMGLGPQWRLRHAPAGLTDELQEEGAGMAGGDAAGQPAAAHAEAAWPQADAPGLQPGMASAEGGAGQAAAPGPARFAVAAGGAGGAPAGQLPEADRFAAAGGAPGGQAVAQAGRQAGPAAPAAGQRGEQAGWSGNGVANGAGNASGGAPAQALQTARPAPSAAGDEDTSWFDDAPAAPAARPALKSAAPARAPTPPKAAAPEAGAESYAWFDDVPATPVSKPARAPAPERESEPDIGASAAAPAAPRTASRPAERQAPPADEMPWFDDAPLPSFDALPDDIAFDDQYGEEEAGVSAAAIARMDWPALRAAVQACTRCGLCRERSAAVPGRGPAQAPWLVLGTAPGADDEAQARPLAGAPGQLLDNMLKAIAIAPEQDAYVTTLVKCRPPGDRAPTADETAACRPYLEREIVLAGTRAVVALGHTAAKGLLGAAARGKVLRLQHIPVVATYHPADLLRKPEDKARAWADLCLARSAFDGRGA